MIYKTPGTAIGNPVGRLALSAVTGRDEVTFDLNWERGLLEHPGFRALAKAGWSRRQIAALKKYADDNNLDSLLLCVNCLRELNQDAFRVESEDADDFRKFLDMRQIFVQRKTAYEASADP